MPSVATIAPVLLAVASISTAQPFQPREAEAEPVNFQNGWNRAKSWTVAHKGQIEHDGMTAAKIGLSAAPLLLMREAEADFGDDMLDNFDLYSRDAEAEADADPFFRQAAATVRNKAVGGWNWARGHKSEIGKDAWDTTKIFSEVAPVAVKALKRDQILSELYARDVEDLGEDIALGLWARDAEAFPPRMRAAWNGAKNKARSGWRWVNGHKMEVAGDAGEAIKVGADLAELAPKVKRDAEADWNNVQQRARQQFHQGYNYVRGHKMQIAENAGEVIKVGSDLAELAPKAKRDPEAELYDDDLACGLYARDLDFDGEEYGLFERDADADAEPVQTFTSWYQHASPAMQHADRNVEHVAQVGGKWVWSNMGTIKNGLDAAEDLSKLYRGQ